MTKMKYWPPSWMEGGAVGHSFERGLSKV